MTPEPEYQTEIRKELLRILCNEFTALKAEGHLNSSIGSTGLAMRVLDQAMPIIAEESRPVYRTAARMWLLAAFVLAGIGAVAGTLSFNWIAVTCAVLGLVCLLYSVVKKFAEVLKLAEALKS